MNMYAVSAAYCTFSENHSYIGEENGDVLSIWAKI